jgi:hypothetical protein
MIHPLTGRRARARRRRQPAALLPQRRDRPAVVTPLRQSGPSTQWQHLAIAAERGLNPTDL